MKTRLDFFFWVGAVFVIFSFVLPFINQQMKLEQKIWVYISAIMSSVGILLLIIPYYAKEKIKLIYLGSSSCPLINGTHVKLTELDKLKKVKSFGTESGAGEYIIIFLKKPSSLWEKFPRIGYVIPNDIANLTIPEGVEEITCVFDNGELLQLQS